ncbi:hypothetical protein [Rhodococcus qingshengii]|uniref:hypothetical protein n=1 Tax=Rhodococcus qingshengii TaxID=334542 RepID=UPI0035D76704
MPKFIVKTSPDDDLYMRWSTVTDSCLFTGTRKQFLRNDFEEDRLRHADETGSSLISGKTGKWEDDSLFVASTHYRDDAYSYCLDRENFFVYADLLRQGREEAAEKFLRGNYWTLLNNPDDWEGTLCGYPGCGSPSKWAFSLLRNDGVPEDEREVELQSCDNCVDSIAIDMNSFTEGNIPLPSYFIG